MDYRHCKICGIRGKDDRRVKWAVEIIQPNKFGIEEDGQIEMKKKMAL